VLDSLIPLNFRLHNTLWVPGHFHIYLMLGVVFWLMAFVVHLLERAAAGLALRHDRRPLGDGRGRLHAGRLLVPRRRAGRAAPLRRPLPRHRGLQPGRQHRRRVFALGFLVLLAELVILGRAALRRRRQAPALPAATEERAAPAAARRLAAPLTDELELGAAVALATLGLVAFSRRWSTPPRPARGGTTLDHAGQFAFGALLGLALGSGVGPLRRRLERGPSSATIWTVILAPAAMLLAMVPGLYECCRWGWP
jgi:Cytochrome C and Quinol oxidase polypeptide I